MKTFLLILILKFLLLVTQTQSQSSESGYTSFFDFIRKNFRNINYNYNDIYPLSDSPFIRYISTYRN